MCVCVCARERSTETRLDVQAEAGGFYMREKEGKTVGEGGSIPGGIQAASVLCDQDGDDFIRPASFSVFLCCSSALSCEVDIQDVIDLTCQIVQICVAVAIREPSFITFPQRDTLSGTA